VGAAQFLSIALVVAPLTVITIIFGELVPKVFSLRNKEWVCLRLSPGMEWFSYSVWPAVWVLEGAVRSITRWGRCRDGRDGNSDQRRAAIQELHGAASLARMSRMIGQREEGIIVSASRLADTPVRDIMLPAEFMGMLTADQTLSEALVAAHREMHTRFPVTERSGDPQRIIGYVNFKDIIAALRLSPQSPSLRHLVRQLLRFRAETSVADCLEQLIHARNHIALICSSEGEVLGMVTLEDIVEELVGEIHDELVRLPDHLQPAGPGWIAGGFVSLKRLRESAGIELKSQDEKPIYTLNDWIVQRLGRPPRGGDEVNGDGYRVLVRKTRHVLVQEAYLSPIEAGETDGDTVQSLH
jgi:putative hemolysin